MSIELLSRIFASRTAVLCTILLLASCGGDSNDGDSVSTASPPDTGAVTAARLSGTWSTGCTPDDAGESANRYTVDAVAFTGDGFTISSASYSDAACLTSIADSANPNLSGTYTLGNAVITDEGLEATEIDFSVSGSATGAGATPPVLLDLVRIDGGGLYFGEGDFGDIEDAYGEPRPDTLDVENNYARRLVASRN